MNIFQKLSWMQQMGIRHLCDEKPRPLTTLSSPKKSPVDLKKLDKSLAVSKSGLSLTATHPLGGTGVVPAKVMCVLEAPSAAEDRSGVALSGPEGDLLKKMLAAIQLDTQIQTYITYLSPWRPPGARLLTNTEIQEGFSLLQKRIQAVNPKVLLAFGMTVTRALTGTTLGQIRNKHGEYQKIPVFATFAPNFLIKNENYKKQAWADLKAFHAFLEKKL